MPSANEFNLYEALEVTNDATEQEIVTSYKRLARIHHPDKNPADSEATAKFQRILTAYETLKDPSLRRQYDAHLEQPNRSDSHPAFHAHHNHDFFDSFDEDPDDYYDSEFEGFFEHLYRRTASLFFASIFSDISFGGSRTTHGETEHVIYEDHRRQEQFDKQLEEAKRRAAEQHAEKKQRELEKKRGEEMKRSEKETKEREAKERQEARWLKACVKSEAEKQKTCHHDAFWEKLQLRRKFKCGECGKKRGMLCFKCPHCELLACQLCHGTLRKRFVAH